jgi:hypothetical protein
VNISEIQAIVSAAFGDVLRAAGQLTPRQQAGLADAGARRAVEGLRGLRIPKGRRHEGRAVFEREWARWLADESDEGRGRFQTGRVAARARVSKRSVRAWAAEAQGRKAEASCSAPPRDLQDLV